MSMFGHYYMVFCKKGFNILRHYKILKNINHFLMLNDYFFYYLKKEVIEID